jgi:hypothetical protein
MAGPGETLGILWPPLAIWSPSAVSLLTDGIQASALITITLELAKAWVQVDVVYRWHMKVGLAFHLHMISKRIRTLVGQVRWGMQILNRCIQL